MIHYQKGVEKFFKEVISVSLFLKYVKKNLLNIDEVLNVRYFMQLTFVFLKDQNF